MVRISETLSALAYRAYEKKLQKEVKSNPIPTHLAVIMDGNRRFAENLGFALIKAHQKGRDKLEKVLGWCLELDIKILTVYAFSTENVSRTSQELKYLMDLFEKNFKALGDDDRIHRNKIKVTVLGNINKLPKKVRNAIKYVEEKTKKHDKYFFNLAVAYGGREEITYAICNIAKDAKCGKIDPDKITENLVSSYLYTKDMPDPDLVLRTSGELRISNFLLWQLAYSELYFVDVYWPEFRKIDLLRAIRTYQQRARRMGK